MNPWGIKAKVFLLTLLPTLSVAILLSTVFVFTRLSDLSQALVKQGSDSAKHLANAAEYGILTGNSNQLIGLSAAVLEEEDVASVTIYGYKRQILAHSGPRIQEPHTIPASLAKQPTIYASELVLRFSAPVRLKDLSIIQQNTLPSASAGPISLGNIVGWAVIEVSRKSTDKAKLGTVIFATLIVIITFLISTIMALRLSRNLASPIQQFGEALKDIKDGKLDTRILGEVSPEFVTLQEGINGMAESLAQARTEMQDNIDRATHDLRETLETIEIQNIELDIARKEALEASRVKSEFLANMSHEIRTPLNGIIGFTKLLAKSNLTIQQRDQLNTILKSSEILLTIINDILDFSKIEAGKLVLDNAHLKLREIIEDVLTMLAPGAHEKNLDLAGLIYSDVPTCIMGDPLRVKQIITNLVSNGIKFTQSGEVIVRVMLEDETSEQATIKISVTDTGLGLSRVQQQSLFSPFTQADASTARRYGGTGLGLVISRRLTEQMGGKIGVDSELGKGSEFWIVLTAKILEQETTAEKLPIASVKNERLIYLESQSKTGLAITHILNSWGAKVDTVNDSDQLIDQVIEAQKSDQGYAVAIIGITRHHLKSASLTETVKKLEYQLDCRTLLLTPTLDAGGEEPPVFAEASSYLIKPPSQKRLAITLNQLIEGIEEPEVIEHAKIVETNILPRKPKVLAVDDNSANLKLVNAFLEDLGAITDIARSGYEALTKAKLKRYDIIFMDVQMPGMDGIATTMKIREFEGEKYHTPIVALTAHAMSDERSRLLSCGFDDYLTKPTNEDELQKMIVELTGFELKPKPEFKVNSQQTGTIKPSVKKALAPPVDINASVHLAGHKPDLAEELFSMLLESLPSDREKISLAFSQENYADLLEFVHKLHGATRYCGVPLMRKAASELETKIKSQETNLGSDINTLLDEIDRVLYWADRNDWQTKFREMPP